MLRSTPQGIAPRLPGPAAPRTPATLLHRALTACCPRYPTPDPAHLPRYARLHTRTCTCLPRCRTLLRAVRSALACACHCLRFEPLLPAACLTYYRTTPAEDTAALSRYYTYPQLHTHYAPYLPHRLKIHPPADHTHYTTTAHHRGGLCWPPTAGWTLHTCTACLTMRSAVVPTTTVGDGPTYRTAYRATAPAATDDYLPRTLPVIVPVHTVDDCSLPARLFLTCPTHC